MSTLFIDRRRVRQGLTLLFLAGALACMFPPRHPACVWWAGQAPYVASGYLLTGLFLLVLGRTRLMFICFGCSAAISFFFNEAADRPGAERPPPGTIGWHSAVRPTTFSPVNTYVL